MDDLTRSMLILSGYFDRGWPMTEHTYGCVMADAPAPLLDKINAWSRYRIEDFSLYRSDTDPSINGREWASHVTVLYGLHTANPLDVADLIEAKQIAPFDVALGSVSLFSKPDYDVVKIDVTSPELMVFHDALLELPNSNEYPVYVPHLTIAYVKAGVGFVFEDADNFAGITFKVDRVRFSADSGRITTIPLYEVTL
jgi:2'-5' RNA ligase